MEKEQSSKDTVEQIMWEVCGIRQKSKKNKKSKNFKNKRLIESDIDIFADAGKEQESR